tara:strand:+ start:20235 stop:20576 length:342 start_codon:yes stop_codon:yes gene_type:complete
MLQSIISIVAIIVMVEMSRRADARYRSETTLPMQWLLDGTVIRTAPRRFALAFFPALLAFVLGVMVVASLMLTPRPGEEGLVIPAIACVALLCVGLHVFYLRLVARSLGGWGK